MSIKAAIELIDNSTNSHRRGGESYWLVAVIEENIKIGNQGMHVILSAGGYDKRTCEIGILLLHRLDIKCPH